jgi:uncharacterized membrane protein YraQ (UPF0718 family)
VRTGDAPTWHAATTFFHAYFSSIWQALVVALLISASVQAFLPRSWLPRVLIVIPTAGEIPILQGLALLGVSSGTLGALLITLPAVSVPGVAMVARSFGWKAVVTTTVMVIAAGLLGATVLSLL